MFNPGDRVRVLPCEGVPSKLHGVEGIVSYAAKRVSYDANRKIGEPYDIDVDIYTLECDWGIGTAEVPGHCLVPVN